MRSIWSAALICLWLSLGGAAEERSYFLGGSAGFSILSADGANSLEENAVATSSYKPENGFKFQVHGGRHLTDMFSLQASYGWNRNSVKLASTAATGDQAAFYEQVREATQHAVIGELLIYFRKRDSWMRPYLSVGGGVIHLRSPLSSVDSERGTLPPPGGFSSTAPAVRIGVGIDVFLKDGFAFRYMFNETIRPNEFSKQLTPQGSRNLANFENMFGFVKYF